jgi:MoaA/NifB/PqqE/SkfB family radical SAM enzyme
MIINNQPIFYWHLELSSKCVLACPRCPRTEHPDKFKVEVLDLDFIKKIMPPEVLAQTTRILLCGGQGDPIYCKDFLEIVEYIKTTNPDIQINITTNGSHRTVEWWKTLARLLNDIDRVFFSVDGWDQESNNIYRVNSNYASTLQGIKALNEGNKDVNITWSTIVFKFNQDKLDVIRDIAKEHGAHTFQLVKSSLFGSKVPKYVDKELGYDPLEPVGDISTYFHHDRNYFKLNPFKDSPRLRALDTAHNDRVRSLALKNMHKFEETDLLPSCLIGERGLYVDAEGILYPCSWISHPFISRKSATTGKKILWDESIFVEHKDQFDLHKNTLEQVLNSDAWNKLYGSFSSKDKEFIECGQKCSKEVSLFRLKNILKLDINKEI